MAGVAAARWATAWRWLASLPRRLLLALVVFYQRVLSPLKPPTCRFTPSCSEYARQALVRHGAGKGGLLAGWRLLRCQPLCAGGHDPVPDDWRAPWRRAARPACCNGGSVAGSEPTDGSPPPKERPPV